MGIFNIINALRMGIKAPYAVCAALLALVPGVALASDYSCSFDTECYESEACAASDFAVEVRGEDQNIATDFGTFPILAIRDEANILTIFVNSEGAVYLLSANTDPEGDASARFTAHVTDGPQSITYLGTCERVG